MAGEYRRIRGKSWVGRAEDVIKQVCGLDNINPDGGWAPVPSAFSCSVRLDRRSGEQSPLAVHAEVNTLFIENPNETKVIYKICPL